MRCGGSVLGAVLAWIGLASVTACATESLPDDENIYYAGVTEPIVLCAASIDDKYGVTDDELDRAIARAQRHGRTLHLYAHDPGVTVSLATIEHLLATAAARDVPLVPYAALGTGGHAGTIALSFDDNSVADWTAMRPLLTQYAAHVTFFVTRYLVMTDDEHAQLHQLAADGHDIEYHTVSHQNAVDYVAANGIDAYLANEISPALDAMRADGFEITEFAYPFGARSPELDGALAPYFHHLRAIHSTCPR
jgi:hypothetical protein